MDPIGRITKIARASLKAGGDVAGFVTDLATSMVKEDEFEGIMGTLRGVSNKRLWGNEEYGPGFIPHIIGPRGTLGEVIEAVPEPVREGTNDLFEVWEDAYREVARYPTTVLTAGSLAARGDFTDLFEGDTWKDAWHIADPGWNDDDKEYPTLGRALSYLIFNIDILDEDEKYRHESTSWHKYVSGTTDFVAMIALDPTVVGGKVIKGVRGGGNLGLIASKLGVPGTRGTLNVASKHRQGGAYDRLVVKPYLRLKMGKTKMDEATETIETVVKNRPYEMVLSPRDVMLAGGERKVQKSISVMVARRERYFKPGGRFDRLLTAMDRMMSDASTVGVPGITSKKGLDEIAQERAVTGSAPDVAKARYETVFEGMSPGSGRFIETVLEANPLVPTKRTLEAVLRKIEDLGLNRIEGIGADEVTEKLTKLYGDLSELIRRGDVEGIVKKGEEISVIEAEWYKLLDSEFGPDANALENFLNLEPGSIPPPGTQLDPEYLTALEGTRELIQEAMVLKFGDDALDLVRSASAPKVVFKGDDVLEYVATKLRQRYFKDNPLGAVISRLLAYGYGGHSTFGGASGRELAENVMRFFLGDNSSIAKLMQVNPEVASYLKGIYLANGVVKQGVIPGVVGARANQSKIMNELTPPQLPAALDEVGTMTGMWDTLDDLKAPGVLNPVARLGKNPVRQIRWFTNSATGAPFRWLIDKRAHPHVLFADPNSDRMIERMLRQAKMDPDEIRDVVSWWNTLDEAGRRRSWESVIEKTIDYVISRHHGALSATKRKELARKIFQDYQRSARHAEDDLLRHKMPGGFFEKLEDGSVSITQGGVSGPAKFAGRKFEDVAETAKTPERLRDVGFIPDFTRLNRSASRVAFGLDPRIWGAIDNIDNLLSVYSNYFKATVLLNPKWPMRVVGEEQLRMAAVIGGPDALWNLLTNRRNAQEAVLKNLLTDQQILEMAGDIPKKELEKFLRNILFGVQTGSGRPKTRMVRAGLLGFFVAGVPGAVGLAAGSRVRNALILNRLARSIRNRQTIRDVVASGDKSSANALMESAGFENLEILGYDVERAFGNPVNPLREWENASTAKRGVEYQIALNGDDFKARNIETLGDFNEIIKPPTGNQLKQGTQELEAYRQWYERILNDQWGRSNFTRMLWDDTKSSDDILDWLKNHKDGQATIREMALEGADDEMLLDWIWANREIQSRLLPDVPELAHLRKTLSEGNPVELRQVIKALNGDEGVDAVRPLHRLNKTAREKLNEYGPPTPGEVVKGRDVEKLKWNDLLGAVHKQEELAYQGNKLVKWFKQNLDKGLQRLGGLYTSQLSRHPLFKAVYEIEMKKKLLDLSIDSGTGAYKVTPAALKAMENSSRVTALNSVRTVMYELAEQSNFAESARHFFPFFNAWQEVLTRWVGFTAHNPEFVAKLGITYREAAGLPTYTDPEGKDFVQVYIPDSLMDLIDHSPFFDKADINNEVLLSVSGVNMISAGLPGIFPSGSFAVSRIAREKPTLEEYVDFLFPYGYVPTSGEGALAELEAFIKTSAPAWGRDIYTLGKQFLESELGLDADHGWDDRKYSAAIRNVVQMWFVEMATGDRPEIDPTNPDEIAMFLKEAEHAARSQLMLTTVFKLFTPTNVRMVSPLNKWGDRFRVLYNENPETADDLFMQELIDEGYNEESFFFLTARSTQSLEGLPPTLHAYETREEFKPYFENYPELGGIILGIESGGSMKERADYSQFVYDYQRTEETFTGSGEKQRKALTFLEYITQPYIRGGWAEYRRINDKYYAMLDDIEDENGNPVANMNTSEAKAIKTLRDKEVKLLQERNPLWAEDFDNRNYDKVNFFEGLRKLVDDPKMVGRVDIQLVGEYLDLRDQVTSILATQKSRGKSGTLDASANIALRTIWDTAVANMVSSNPTFRDIWLRWFEFDMLEEETWNTMDKRVANYE